MRLLAEDDRADPPHPNPLPVGARAIPGGPGRALARGTGLLHLAPGGEVGRRPGEGDLRLGPRFLDLSSVVFREKSRNHHRRETNPRFRMGLFRNIWNSRAGVPIWPRSYQESKTSLQKPDAPKGALPRRRGLSHRKKELARSSRSLASEWKLVETNVRVKSHVSMNPSNSQKCCDQQTPVAFREHWSRIHRATDHGHAGDGKPSPPQGR